MPDISTLTSQVQQLEKTVDWWNWAVIWMMVVAAIAATGLVLAQYYAIQRASDLSRAQTALSNAKDEMVKEKQGDTDLKIAEANRKHSTGRRKRVCRAKYSVDCVEGPGEKVSRSERKPVPPRGAGLACTPFRLNARPTLAS